MYNIFVHHDKQKISWVICNEYPCPFACTHLRILSTLQFDKSRVVATTPTVSTKYTITRCTHLSLVLQPSHDMPLSIYPQYPLE